MTSIRVFTFYYFVSIKIRSDIKPVSTATAKPMSQANAGIIPAAITTTDATHVTKHSIRIMTQACKKDTKNFAITFSPYSKSISMVLVMLPSGI